MAIFSDLELQRIMNEDHVSLSVDTRETDSKIKKQIQDRTGQIKDLAAKATANAKSNIWLNKKKADDSSKGRKRLPLKKMLMVISLTVLLKVKNTLKKVRTRLLQSSLKRKHLI